MRREWIEMKCCIINIEKITKSPSMRREWIEMQWNLNTNKDVWRLPPCGGSGLKSQKIKRGMRENASPSMRREWIEMMMSGGRIARIRVSLHAEGVD